MRQLDLNGAIFHNRCACHIINLIVQVGVKSIRDDLESIKWIVGYIFCSPSRKQWWRDICVNLGLRPKKISQDVKHRWNFTYKMLKQACAYKMA